MINVTASSIKAQTKMKSTEYNRIFIDKLFASDICFKQMT